MANKKPHNGKSTSPKLTRTVSKPDGKADATAAAAVPDPKSYPPELAKAIESFGNMAGYYVQCLPGDSTEKSHQVAGVVLALQRVLFGGSGCPRGWAECNDGNCVPPGGLC
jgi:hypothetical protein